MLSFKVQASKDEGGRRDVSLRVRGREELVILPGKEKLDGGNGGV